MEYTEFESDEQYYAWLADHPNGFVLNMRRKGQPNYIRLHRAGCSDIGMPAHENEPGGFTERDYIKVGADDVETLRQWAAAKQRPDPADGRQCGHCKPLG